MNKVLNVLIFLVLLINLINGLDRSYCKCRAPIQSRIVGGRYSKQNAYPWMVSMSVFDVPEDKKKDFPETIKIALHSCGGVVLSERYILTAAHCVASTHLDYSFGMGSNDLVKIFDIGRIKVKNIFRHPDHNMSGDVLKNDIAIVELSQPIKFSDVIQPACLETMVYKNYGNNIVVTGFGKIEQTIVDKKTDKPLPGNISRYLKEADYRDISKTDSNCKKNQGLICVDNIYENESVCHGDSGGPALYNVDSKAYVIGVTSGSDYSIKNDTHVVLCNGYAVYTRIGYYMNWIKGIVKDEIC